MPQTRRSASRRPALRRGALLAFACLLASPPLADASLLTSLRLDPGPERYALTLDTTSGLEAVSLERLPDVCRIRIPGLEADPVLVPPLAADPLIKGLAWRQEGSDAVLEISWQYPVPVNLVPDPLYPGRLKIQFERLFTERTERVLAPGLRYEQLRRGLAHGPLSAHILRIDRERLVSTSSLRLGMGGDGMRFSLEPTSGIARRHGAIAAVNGGYFARTGEPLGLVMHNRQVLSGPINTRSLLAFGGTSTPFVDGTQMSGSIQLPNGESTGIDGINQRRWDGQLMLYTPLWGATTRTEPASSAVEFAVLASGQVIGRSQGDLAIPPGGFVLSASGAEAEWLSRRLRVGDRLSYQTDLTLFWRGIDHILAGGPRLLNQGKVQLTTVDERFQPDIAVGRAPRTAVGITAKGGVILAVVDGRQSRLSVGLTLPETADFMRELGAQSALNLDGGGSSTMVIEGEIVNRPSDGRERPVSNALLVY
ncbi:hypothetical protein D3C86_344460 [compost metagenome]